MATQKQKDTFAKNIKYYLNERGLTQTQLAKMLDYPEMTVSNWVNAKYYPRIDKIQEMADFLSINKSDLIEDKIETNTNKLTTDQEQLITHYNNSNTQGKTIILTTAKNISKAYPVISRDEMISYLKQFQRAAYGDMKSIYDMTDEELEQLYIKYKEDFEDD